MPRSTPCPACDVTLTVPDEAVGRRLKCPKCGAKFYDSPASRSGLRSSPPPEPPQGRRPASTFLASVPEDVPLVPDEPPLPTAEGDLRTTFDLPMMHEGEAVPARPRSTSDAEALFRDTGPVARKPTAAESRAQTRRCPTCGQVVPAGMSLCSSCGLDLETGRRVDLFEDLDTEPLPSRPSGPPLSLAVIGGVGALASLILAGIAFWYWFQGLAGAQFLGLICLFGLYASIQFLRLKSIKLFLIALTLGVGVNLVALIFLPVFHAYQRAGVRHNNPAVSPDAPEIIIENPVQYLDVQQLSWGIALLLVYAALMLYLFTPSVRRHFR